MQDMRGGGTYLYSSGQRRPVSSFSKTFANARSSVVASLSPRIAHNTDAIARELTTTTAVVIAQSV